MTCNYYDIIRVLYWFPKTVFWVLMGVKAFSQGAGVVSVSSCVSKSQAGGALESSAHCHPVALFYARIPWLHPGDPGPSIGELLGRSLGSWVTVQADLCLVQLEARKASLGDVCSPLRF